MPHGSPTRQLAAAVFERLAAHADYLIDLHSGGVEYDFVVSPGTDPSVIRLAVTGANSLSLTASGDLDINTGAGDIVQKAPTVYQDGGGIGGVAASVDASAFAWFARRNCPCARAGAGAGGRTDAAQTRARGIVADY